MRNETWTMSGINGAWVLTWGLLQLELLNVMRSEQQILYL